MSVPAAAPARPFPTAWLVAAACAAFVLFLAALAFGPELAAGRGKGADALSRSPVGYAALATLLRADGVDVRFNRDPLLRARLSPATLVVLTPLPDTAVAEIAAAARRRRVLLIPPKWLAAPDPRRLGRLARLGVLPPRQALAQATAVLSQHPGDGAVTLRWEGGVRPLALAEPPGEHDLGFPPARLPPVTGLRTLDGAAGQAVLVDAQRHAVLQIAHSELDWVLADPDLVNNHGVADLAGAKAAVRMVERLADGAPVVFDLTLAGVAAKRSVLRGLFTAPFAPATVCALLLAALAGLLARERFGALRRPDRAYAFGKRGLVDSAASLLAVAGREPRLAPRYAELVRAEAAAAAGVAGAREAQDAALDRIGRARGAESWTALAAEAPGVRTRAELMEWARRAARWRTEMTRGRG